MTTSALEALLRIAVQGRSLSVDVDVTPSKVKQEMRAAHASLVQALGPEKVPCLVEVEAWWR
jgi:hypothetical protein